MSEPTTPAKTVATERDAAIKKHLRRGYPLEAATRLADAELAPVPEVIPEASPEATTTKKKKQPATE